MLAAEVKYSDVNSAILVNSSLHLSHLAIAAGSPRQSACFPASKHNEHGIAANKTVMNSILSNCIKNGGV